MKIGIITFINTINFGASLQAYALQEKINQLGYEAEIIQYTNKVIEEKEKNSGKIKNINSLMKKIVMGKGIKEKVKAFKEFEFQNMKFGLQLTDENSISDLNNYYDYFITGSDQVWNMAITHEDWKYFLNFVNDDNKKISYAASFGNNIFPEEDKKIAGNELRKFKSISVREQSGRKLIKDISDKNATVVLDPTLLLNKSEWEEKIKFKPKLEHYILLYFPQNKKKMFKFAKKLSKRTGYPIVYLSISPRIFWGTKTIYNASPDEFLGWMKNADYVITGSFHGTAYSLNLQKEFFYEPSGAGSRIDNIVKITGTESRSIENENVMGENINYKDVEEKLNSEREKSIEFLKKSLEK